MKSRRILIVEDDSELVEALKTVLEGSGYVVATATNREEARAEAERERPDLAILDVMLDTVDEGVQITHEFRRSERLRDIPIIMLTAINQKMPLKIGREVEEGYLPVDRFMEKPVDPEELLEAVSELT